DGTRYRGWQRLAGADNTIQGKIEQCLSKILGEEIEISGSGRTDAGVHAQGQVANFHCESTMPAGQILENLRRYLPEDIGIYSCKDCSPRFHARLNAKEKTYCYRIWNSDSPCVFQRRFVAIMPERLDVDAMKVAAQQLCGEHDFSAFCGNPKFKKSTVRYIRDIRLERDGDELKIYFTGNGFIHNQVRIMVGTLVEVGRGERTAESIPDLFGGKRADAGFLAPAQGLCLMEVIY
ncbi:MAG: tRNA pseudouridine(38-40) synthase TruA, partial [Oscillospiraceae bacterium]|nr:tRNA pseudouridine(38-40) synthase TruA [Oscillospiraceae bacterium]